MEFALLVPFLIALLFGIISLAFMFSQLLALNNAVREGARFAVTAGNPTSQRCDQIQPTVQDRLEGTTISDPTAVTVTARRLGAGSDCTGTTRLCVGSFDTSSNTIDSIEVDATYPAAFILPLPLGPSITLTARAVYRCEFTS